MDVAITGSSGLIGTALKRNLRAAGHRPIAVVRRAPKSGADEIRWDPAAGELDAASLEGVDAVVNLGGAGIGDKRWSDERKRVIYDSRVDSTALLATTLAGLDAKPSVFVSGSAVGYYGSQGDTELTESSPAATDFLADLCVQWEAAAQPAIDAGIRTVLARTGVVMSRTGGVLDRQLPLFKLGLGGKMGPGTQWFPWISLDDEVGALMYLIDNEISGPVNLVAPNSVTNAGFTTALGSAVGRPTLLPVPMFGPKLLFGAELVDALILGSQRVIPGVLNEAGYEFIHPTIEDCFADILARTKEVA